ncbi:hypothetical protein Q3G72_009177 [Acer saccharum]|nr:hypothetical protein Q3G72_009177 [Acer saccharum]
MLLGQASSFGRLWGVYQLVDLSLASPRRAQQIVEKQSCLMLSSATVKMLLYRMDSSEYLVDQRQENWMDELKNENEFWIGDCSGYVTRRMECTWRGTLCFP